MRIQKRPFMRGAAMFCFLVGLALILMGDHFGGLIAGGIMWFAMYHAFEERGKP